MTRKQVKSLGGAEAWGSASRPFISSPAKLISESLSAEAWGFRGGCDEKLGRPRKWLRTQPLEYFSIFVVSLFFVYPLYTYDPQMGIGWGVLMLCAFCVLRIFRICSHLYIETRVNRGTTHNKNEDIFYREALDYGIRTREVDI